MDQAWQAVLSPEQRVRLARVNQPFYVLSHEVPSTGRAAGSIKCTLSGSTGTAYRVDVARGGTLRCDCPDAKNGARRAGCLCKHVCYLLTKVAGICDPAPFLDKRLDAEGRERLLTRLEHRDVLEALRAAAADILASAPPGASPVDVDRFLESTREFAGAINAAVAMHPPARARPQPRDPDADCPVCYETLRGAAVDACGTCGNGVHADCMRRWRAHHSGARGASCVFCRGVM